MKNKFDCAIVLGAKPESTILKSRLNSAINLYKKDLLSRIIVSGCNESSWMKKYLMQKGINSKNIFKEKKSRDTFGNAFFSKKIIRTLRGRSLVIITSDYHLNRTKLIFKKIFGKNYKIKYIKSKTLKKIPFQKLEKDSLIVTKAILTKIKTNTDSQIKKVLKEYDPFFAPKNFLKKTDKEIAKKNGNKRRSHC